MEQKNKYFLAGKGKLDLNVLGGGVVFGEFYQTDNKLGTEDLESTVREEGASMDIFVDWPMLVFYDKEVCGPEVLVRDFLNVKSFKSLNENKVRVTKSFEDMIIHFPKQERIIRFMSIENFEARRGEKTNLLLIPEHWKDRMKNNPTIYSMMYSGFVAYYDQKQFTKGGN